MTVFPALDLLGGRVVRLAQGNFQRATDYGVHPAEVAARWYRAGVEWIHVVDLDGARCGSPVHLGVLPRIRGTGLRVQFGGGLRTEEAVEEAVRAGADRVLVGTRAVLDPAWLEQLCRRWRDRVVVALDVRDGCVAVRGWTEAVPVSVEEAAERALAAGARRLLVTDTTADGMLAGPNFALYRRLVNLPAKVVASGGVRHAEDLRALREVGVDGVVVGRALYEGALSLEEALRVSRSYEGGL